MGEGMHGGNFATVLQGWFKLGCNQGWLMQYKERGLTLATAEEDNRWLTETG